MKTFLKSMLILIAAASLLSYCGKKKDGGEAAEGSDSTEQVADAGNLGKEVFEGKGQCFTCHGNTGVGDGPLAATLNPKPRNFKTDSFKNGDDLESIKKSIEEGVGENKTMPAHKDMLTAEEIEAVSKYVIELKG